MLDILIRLPGYLALFLGRLLFVRSPSGILGGLIWLPKLWAGARPPCLVLLGSFGVRLGMNLQYTAQRDCLGPFVLSD